MKILIPEELSIKNIEKIFKKIKPYINTTPLKKASKNIDEDFNQESEEELLDIPTFLRRQAN